MLRSSGRLRPGLETLEARILLSAEVVDLGPLRFSAASFSKNGDVYSASGTIEVGFAPTTGESFTPLAEINGTASFTVGTSAPSFTVNDAQLASTVQGTPSQVLWETAGTFDFNVSSLTGSGVSLTGGKTIQVAGANFTIDDLRFANPNGGSTTDAQIKLQGDLAIDQLDGLDVAVDAGDFVIIDDTGVDLADFSAPVTDSFTVFGLSVDPSSLAIAYSGNSGAFSIAGDMNVSTSDGGISGESANFGEAATPGLVVSQGVISTVAIGLVDDFEVFKLPIKPGGLTFEYDFGQQRYEVSGAVTVELSGSQAVPITGNLGDSSDPGMIISNGGQIQSIEMMLNGTFAIAGLVYQVKDADLKYMAPRDEYEISGELEVPELFDTSVTLGTPEKPGITIKDGDFSLDGFKIQLEDVFLGAFVIDDFEVAYSRTSNETSFAVSLELTFPLGWEIGGTVGFEDGKLNTIGLSFEASGTGEGIEIGDTGIEIIGFSGEVQNLEQPADLIVSGSLVLIYGGQVKVLDVDTTLIEVQGSFKVDKDELVLEADVYFGAVSVGESTSGLLGEGEGTLTLDWGEQDYRLDVEMAYYDGIIRAEASIDIGNGGRDIVFFAKAEVDVPDSVPFIGGDTIGSMEFLFEYHRGDPSHSFLAAWAEVDAVFYKFDVGVEFDFNKEFRVIGNKQVDHIKDGANQTAPRTFHYFSSFVVVEGATHGTFSVDWPEAGGTQSIAVLPPGASRPISQGHFSTSNGLSLVQQLKSGTSTAVGVVGSPTDLDAPLPDGEYQVILTSSVKYATAPAFTGIFGYPRPTIALGSLPQNPTAQTIPVPVTGTVDEAFIPETRVSLFVDDDNVGFDGSPVPGAANVPYQPGQALTWDLDGLLPLPHYVYAVINDGTNTAVTSAYSAAVSPVPPLSGTVQDPKHNDVALSGILVYLDLDHDGRFDPDTDPSTTTGASGFYAFHDLSVGTTYDVAVVVPTGFQLDAASRNPRSFTFGGTPVDVDFGLDELAAIKGTVLNSSSKATLPGWPLFLDTNGNGTLDTGEVSATTGPSGRYAFHDVPLNATYTVRVMTQPGFFLSDPASGTRSVTMGNDPFQVIDGQDFGVLRFSTIQGTVSGYALHGGLLDPATTPLAGWTVRLDQNRSIDAGGSAAGSYEADRDFSGGTTITPASNTINTTMVVDPAPQAVYQTNRYGFAFSYDVAGLSPNAAYTVRLHFVETFWDDPGDRIFDVAINGRDVLSDFDILGTAGGKFIAIAPSFTANADEDGTITITLQATTDNAQINGIEITRTVASTTTASDGSYSFGGLLPGRYSITEVVPPDWREIAPFAPDLQLQYPGVDDRWHLDGNAPPRPISVAVADFDNDGTLDFAALDRNPDNSSFPVHVFLNDPFGPQHSYSASPVGDPRELLAGDFFGTGRQDLAVVGSVAKVSLLQNAGDGIFSGLTGVVLTPSQQINDAVAGSFIYGSGRDQLLISNFGNFGVAGEFLTFYDPLTGMINRIDSDMTVPIKNMVAGDLNGDGFLDVAGNAGGQPILFYGDGQGDFTPLIPSAFPFQGESAAVAALAVGDINGDGRLDLAIYDGLSNQVIFTLQDAAKRFTTIVRTDLRLPKTAISSLILRDFDGDLRPDLAWLVEGEGNEALFVAINQGEQANWFENATATRWSLAPGAAGGLVMQAGDFNADGLLDLLVADERAGNVEIVYNRSAVNDGVIAVTVDGGNNADSTGNAFVNVQLGQVNGRVFEDPNRDGQPWLSRSGRAGATVFVDLNRNGLLDPGEPSSVTGPHGVYAFDGLADGTYQVRTLEAPGRTLTTPAAGAHEVVVDPRSLPVTGADFGSADRLIEPIVDQMIAESRTLSIVASLTPAAGTGLRFRLGPGAPEGARIDPITGLFTWTPTEAQGPGTFVISVIAFDPSTPTRTETETFTVAVSELSDSVQYVTDLYRTVLGREPDPFGLAAWVARLDAGASRLEVARGFWESPEHRGLQVDQFYATYLNRPADPEGRAFWVGALLAGVGERTVKRLFLTSPEYRSRHSDATSYLVGLYQDVLGRPPDPSGLELWRRAARRGMSRVALARRFLMSEEAVERQVDSYYHEILGRPADPLGRASWVSQLERRRLAPSQVAEEFLASPEFFDRTLAGLPRPRLLIAVSSEDLDVSR